MLSLSFRLDGVPVPKARARVTRYGSFTPQKTVDYEEAIGEAAMVAFAKLQWMGKWPTDARYDVTAGFCFYRRLVKGSKTKRVEPSKADGDNCLKSVMDGLEKVLYVNDNQVDSGRFIVERDAAISHTWVVVRII